MFKKKIIDTAVEVIEEIESTITDKDYYALIKKYDINVIKKAYVFCKSIKKYKNKKSILLNNKQITSNKKNENKSKYHKTNTKTKQVFL